MVILRELSTTGAQLSVRKRLAHKGEWMRAAARLAHASLHGNDPAARTSDDCRVSIAANDATSPPPFICCGDNTSSRADPAGWSRNTRPHPAIPQGLPKAPEYPPAPGHPAGAPESPAHGGEPPLPP